MPRLRQTVELKVPNEAPASVDILAVLFDDIAIDPSRDLGIVADDLGAQNIFTLFARRLGDTSCAEFLSGGFWVTPTVGPRKVRFRGQQDRVYRFVYCITSRRALGSDQVVRHRCNNRRCVNPAHLTFGTRHDNLLDDRGFRANGVDFNFL
jgi:hypothetical protein